MLCTWILGLMHLAAEQVFHSLLPVSIGTKASLEPWNALQLSGGGALEPLQLCLFLFEVHKLGMAGNLCLRSRLNTNGS